MQSSIITALVALAIVAASKTAQAQDLELVTISEHPYDEYDVGVGAVLGDPTALTFEGRFDANNAIQLHVGWALVEPRGSRFVLAIDYLRHFIVAPEKTVETGWFTPYVGLGAKVGLRGEPDAAVLGVRVPLGLAFLFRDAPVEAFLEVVPGIHVFPNVSPLFDGGLGARIYF